MPASGDLDIRANVLHGAEASGSTIQWAEGLRLPRKWFHKDWLRRAAAWRLFRLCYVGGDEFITSKDPLTLFSHERESDKSYLDRTRRAFYRNHCAPIVGLKSDAIYQPQVLRAQAKLAQDLEKAAEKDLEKDEDANRVKRAQSGDETFEAFLGDVDLQGTNADPFWNEVCRWARVYGKEWVEIAVTGDDELVARARAANRRISQAEAQEAGIRPYLAMHSPLSVINWGRDARKRLTFAVVIGCEEERLALPNAETEQPGPRFVARILTRTHVATFLLGPRGGLTPIGSTLHDFGEVPIVPVTVRPDERSDLEDIGRINVAVFNDDALIEEQVYRQVFAQMVGKVKDKKAFMDNVSGVSSLMTISAADNEDLFFLAPPASPIETIRQRITDLEDAMWSIANLRSRPGAKGAQPAADVSGVAYAFEHKNAETDLAGSAVRLEEAEKKILTMRARAVKAKPEGLTVEYPRTFDIRALQAAAAEAKELLTAQLGATASAEIRKSLASKALRTLPAGVRAKINREIDELSTKEAAAGEKPKAPPSPPNQSQQPPGKGAAEDRIARSFKEGDEIELEEAA
jgi:hypothetical protein